MRLGKVKLGSGKVRLQTNSKKVVSVENFPSQIVHFCTMKYNWLCDVIVSQKGSNGDEKHFSI